MCVHFFSESYMIEMILNFSVALVGKKQLKAAMKDKKYTLRLLTQSFPQPEVSLVCVSLFLVNDRCYVL